MTAQTLHRVSFEGEDYALIWSGKLVPFMFERYSLLTLPKTVISTGNWDGYFAKYRIANDTFILNELYVLGLPEPFPLVSDIEAEQIFTTYRISRSERKRTGETQKEKVEFSGWVKYAPLAEPLPFTGFLLIGQSFSKERHYLADMQIYYHACGKLKKVTLKDGELEHIEDFSDEATQVRNAIPNIVPMTPDERRLSAEFREKVSPKNE